MWKVIFFTTTSGRRPVNEYLDHLDLIARAKVVRVLSLLKSAGPKLGMPQARSLGAGLYELRIRGNHEVRVFYCYRHHHIIILHAFTKKSMATPMKELGIARQRQAQVSLDM